MAQSQDTPSFEFKCNVEDSICIARCVGVTDYYNLTEAIQSLINNPEIKSHFKLIINLIEMDYHPSYDELMGIVDTLKLLKETFKEKVALITRQNLNIIAKLITIYCELAGMKMKAFTSTDDAKKWVTSPD
ncbi:hypothetical protein GM418_17010 [Maribellus comscasis]|uniref:STAS/SEC14 domain-containing protein n=1 Tax=Maribellus comscasis TaxID=2681766 RepID=A0A6I6JS93_9BACT|nr:hypothetical protein [Maribellus comscasis]QGY45311.1 hypothetical protein GM418_17010 [Maribellus comscasis]